MRIIPYAPYAVILSARRGLIGAASRLELAPGIHTPGQSKRQLALDDDPRYRSSPVSLSALSVSVPGCFGGTAAQSAGARIRRMVALHLAAPGARRRLVTDHLQFHSHCSVWHTRRAHLRPLALVAALPRRRHRRGNRWLRMAAIRRGRIGRAIWPARRIARMATALVSHPTSAQRSHRRACRRSCAPGHARYSRLRDTRWRRSRGAATLGRAKAIRTHRDLQW